jgi:hypothetical protein
VLAFGVALWWPGPTAVGAEPRYVAVLADGTRVEGRQVSGWGDAKMQPKLDATELLDPSRPFRWLRDLTLSPDDVDPESTGLVELTNGDRVPGRVEAFVSGGADRARPEPPHLVVAINRPLSPGGPAAQPKIRILPQFVRSIVLARGMSRQIEPGTLLFHDGRRFAYRSLRWQADGVRVLTGDGIREAPFSELAGLRLPLGDAWHDYCAELAAIDPECKSRLVRLETTQGWILTATLARLVPAGSGKHNAWRHAIQPAWSLDPIAMPFSMIRAWWTFAPHEIPLSRWLPARFVSRPMLGNGWSWQVDRNVEGGLLASAKQAHGWGFGVHAPCELWFEIPPCARGFQVRVGLDRLAGAGGCARALICLDGPQTPPRFRSKHLIGSTEIVDAGTLALTARDARKYLILVADAADRDRPPGADPLDIRDLVDWIEPLWLLDPAELRSGVEKCK